MTNILIKYEKGFTDFKQPLLHFLDNIFFKDVHGKRKAALRKKEMNRSII